MTGISVVRRWRQGDQKFKIILNYGVSSKTVCDIGGHFRRKTEVVCGSLLGNFNNKRLRKRREREHLGGIKRNKKASVLT